MKMDCLHVRSALSHDLRMKRLAKSILRYEDKQKITCDSVRVRLEEYSWCFSLSHSHTHISRANARLVLMCVTCLTCGHTPMRRLYSADIIEWFMHYTVIKMIRVITALNRCYRQKRALTEAEQWIKKVRIIIFHCSYCMFDQISAVSVTLSDCISLMTFS